MVKCDHCLIEVPESRAIFDETDGQKKGFCCHGCRGIFLLIKEERLEEFYVRREDSWLPGPPDDQTIDPAAFNDSLRQVNGEMETDLVIDGIRCASCIWLNEKILNKTKGVTYARVNYATHKAKIRWDPSVADFTKVLLRIKHLGYTPKPFTVTTHEEELKRQQRSLLIRFGTAAFFSMQLMMYSVALYAGYFQGIDQNTKILLQIISFFLATPVLFYSGWPFMKGSVRGLKNMSFNMDILIITGAGAAYIYSIYQIITGGEIYFDTSAMIITFILLGKYIETGAKGKASETIVRLLSLNPKEARRINNPHSGVPDPESVPVTSIKRGDRIEVRPGEKFPFDGVVVKGTSEANESMLTGESKPVAKSKGSEVFCGTQNLYGLIIFQVVRTGEETVLSQIIRTVEETQARQAPVQALTDRVVGIFVPSVLFLSAVTGISWFIHDRELTQAILNSVSVLVIACPCALGLATPLAILVGSAQSASKGIMIKGSDILERAKTVDTIVLDKTGTITEGKPTLSLFKGISIPDAEALRIAFSLERLSEHSIAKAFVDCASNIEPYAVTDFQTFPGKGICGKVNGKIARIGSRRYIELEGLTGDYNLILNSELSRWIKTQERSGLTVVYMSYDKALAGIFIISDTVREGANELIQTLVNQGFLVFMITGDNQETAVNVGRDIGLGTGKVMAQKSPVEKAEAIKEMQKNGRHIIMVGDGINDAPALVQAEIGVAMGRATDIALESADMVLMRNDLRLILDAIGISRNIYRIIRQNLFWAFAYNIAALPLAVSGMLHPVVAAISMTLSSLSVVGNSMRLRGA